MRVKMLNSRVGVNVTFDGGSEYDLPEARALRWIASGFAVAVEEAEIMLPAEEEAAVVVAAPAEVTPEPEAPVAAVIQIAPKRGRRK